MTADTKDKESSNRSRSILTTRMAPTHKADAKSCAEINVSTPKDCINDQSECPLFKLPPELRNSIYRLVLVDDIDGIALYSPGESDIRHLLATCRQIRNEAIESYHLENVFHFLANNCDHKDTQRYVDRVVRPLGDAVLSKWQACLCPTGADRGCWPNLLTWCRAVWDGTLPWDRFTLDTSSAGDQVDKVVIEGALLTAWEARSLPWPSLLLILEELRKVAALSSAD